MATSTTMKLPSRNLHAKGVCCRHGKGKGVHGEQELEYEE